MMMTERNGESSHSHAWEYTEVGMLNEIECCRNCSSRLDKGEFDSRKQVSLKKGRLAVLIYCLMFQL
ncbi:TPA: hypothetical protein ACF311_000110 [Vibrio parahaemolyticus]|nr:hypothetical protein [Vibrio parahaemolyticus]MDF4790725.1 hypothetical protein [Vibrio parahaemolyticus]HBC3898336.1 hypothetical protein [Vibrio parahaemolyticus]HCH4058356.1 hypothetical protein [Vibrio parahaemolyticus]